MKRLSPGSHLRGVSIQAAYILGRYTRHYTTLVVLAGIIYSVALLVAVVPAGLDILMGVSALIMLGYLASVIQIASSMASELESGEALLYLSTPLSRLSYVSSWLLASLSISAGTFMLTLVIPLIAIDPGALLAQKDLLKFILAVIGEVVYYTVILTAVGIIVKKRNLTSAVGFFMLLLGPMISVIVFVILEAVAGNVDGDLVASVIGIFHPLVLSQFDPDKMIGSIMYSYTVSLIVAGIIIQYARRSLEV
ncbi:MAG: hypothetical protein GSR86_02690 [Desulfurococcales archaeon]|nr:hypothetical protein [Desulfurococcales archaeon]